MAKRRIGDIASLFYILACIFSFGGVWITKIIVQKAIVDAYNSIN
jgi:hypothetical protein